jgi:hypothetical protein
LYVDEFQNIATDSFATVLAEARKFGLCLTMAHQSLKQVDDKLAALILGNAQTQVYFRVGRQDAERLAKESSNIIEQLIEQDENEPLMQERERKFSMNELWEAAFHQLARLEARKAYVMVKGAMEHPELIRTVDNPMVKSVKFPYGESAAKLEELQATLKQRTKDCSQQLAQYVELRRVEKTKKREAPAEEPSAAPETLDFFDS